MNYNAISLFSSSGIGDLGLKQNNIKTVIACELLADRMNLFKSNFPETKCFQGDIWELQKDIISFYKENYTENPFLIIATPPCQGMSSNGMGKMLSDYRKGLRPKQDPRNRLIIPSVNIIKELEPQWIIFENVPTMLNTLIYDENNQLINIIDFIKRELGNMYIGVPQVIDTADYGVPQHRKRLLTVLARRNKNTEKYFSENDTFMPLPTHSKKDTPTTNHWITLRDAIGNLPELRAEKGKNENKVFNPLHKVPVLDSKKLFWLDNTPEGETAFNNQCINPKCMYKNNALHGSETDTCGVNKSKEKTPLFCEKCGSLLPRPYVEDKKTGELRLMKGFVSAYKRMNWDEPASTLTQNFQYACSDNKVHPSQTRVLSLYEGLSLQTITDYPYSFEINGKIVPDGVIRDTIGESIPPRITDLITQNIMNISKNSTT